MLSVRYGPIELSEKSPGEDAPPPRPLFKRMGDMLLSFFGFVQTFAVKLVVAIGVVALVAAIARDLRGDPVVIERLSVPKQMEALGLTGDVSAHLIWDAIQQVQAKAGTQKSHAAILSADKRLDVVEPGTGLSFQAVTEMLRQLLGRSSLRISGELVCSDEDCSDSGHLLRLRVFNGKEMVSISPGRRGGRDERTYLRDAALEVLKVIDPYVVAAYLRRNPDTLDEARRLARQLIAVDDRNAHWAANMLGNLARDEGRLDDAHIWFQTSLEISRKRGLGDFAVALVNKGSVFNDWGDRNEALRLWRKTLRADPALGVTYRYIANLLHDYGQHDQGLALLDEGIEAAPGSPWPLQGKGDLLTSLAELDAARRAYEDAIHVDPGEGSSYAKLAIFLRKHGVADDGEGDSARARRLLKEGYAAEPNDASVLLAFAQWHEEGGDYAAAADYFKRVAVLIPKSDWAMQKVFQAQRNARKHEESVVTAVAMVERDQSNPVKWLMLIGAQIRAKKYMEAVGTLNEFRQMEGAEGLGGAQAERLLKVAVQDANLTCEEYLGLEMLVRRVLGEQSEVYFPVHLRVGYSGNSFGADRDADCVLNKKIGRDNAFHIRPRKTRAKEGFMERTKK